MADSSSAFAKTIIYREYVLKHFPEYSPSGGAPGNFPTSPSFEFNPVDFIIGFASEKYNPNEKGTGNFHPTWDLVTFSPEKVKKLKESYPHVRVVISIGGGMGTYSPFNPDEKDVWIATAVNSLEEIIHIYDDNNQKNLIDGIDIHYSDIKSNDFSYCIGKVIKSLKNDPRLTIKVVSIAAGEYNQPDYLKLYVENQNYIDIVHYMFSNWRHSKEDVVAFYKKLVADYRPITVLPGYLNPPLPKDKAKVAVIYLVIHNLAPGFFTYPLHPDHDSPVAPPGPFSFEEDASKHI